MSAGVKKGLRITCLVVGVLALVGFFSVEYTKTVTADQPAQVVVTVGLSFSPWYRYARDSTHTSSGIDFASWSTLVGFVGLAFVYGYHWLGRTE